MFFAIMNSFIEVYTELIYIPASLPKAAAICSVDRYYKLTIHTNFKYYYLDGVLTCSFVFRHIMEIF